MNKSAHYQIEYDDQDKEIGRTLLGYSTEFCLFPSLEDVKTHIPTNGWYYLRGRQYNWWAEEVYPGPGFCQSIGSATPSGYWQAVNQWYVANGHPPVEERDFIGVTLVRETINEAKGYYRLYNDCYYYEYSASYAPISAEFAQYEGGSGKTTVYSCNVP